MLVVLASISSISYVDAGGKGPRDYAAAKARRDHAAKTRDLAKDRLQTQFFTIGQAAQERRQEPLRPDSSMTRRPCDGPAQRAGRSYNNGAKGLVASILAASMCAPAAADATNAPISGVAAANVAAPHWKKDCTPRTGKDYYFNKCKFAQCEHCISQKGNWWCSDDGITSLSKLTGSCIDYKPINLECQSGWTQKRC